MALFEESAARRVDKTAFIVRDERLTYGQIESAANRAARLIAGLSGTANHPVAALLEESVETVVAMLAILKTGKAYVPLNAVYPPARLQYMLEESEARLLVTDAAHADLAATLADGRGVVNLDSLGDGLSDAAPGLAFRADDLACILYTSGSTGEPKGVYNDHHQFYPTVMTSRESVGIRESDVFLLFGSFAASGPARAALWALISGATLRMGTADDLGDIPDCIRRENVTIANMGPSILTRFLDSFDGRALPSLRLVYTAGEPFPRTLLERFFAAVPSGVEITNGYGLSETGPVCNFHMHAMPEFEGDLVPIGVPVAHTRVLLLDENLEGVAPGETGQIAVISPGSATGYWKKADLTAERFVTDPETGARMCLSGDLGRLHGDGNLLHLGRKDNLLKIRGWSVDLSEVEGALRAHPSVKDAAAAVRQDRGGEARLVGYVVANEPDAADVAAIRRFLGDRLPDYMVPAGLVALDALPLTVTGKLDRRALPAPEGQRGEMDTPYVAARTPVEEALAAIFAASLGLDRVGVDDNFFELGGHSLDAARVISAVADTLRVDVAMSEFFARPTVAGMAALVVERLASSAEADMEALLAELESPASPTTPDKDA